MKKIAMIGVGKLGQDCAEVMADAGHDVVGFDIEPRLPMFPMKDTIKEAVFDRDIIFIAAPTAHDPIYGGETPTSHLPNKDFDYTVVTGILQEVNKHVNKHQLVVLISTVLPGTVRSILEPCITNARFIYNPYLIAMGTVKWDMVNPEMVIIGTDDGSLTGDASELIDFYKGFMQNNPRYEVGTWDEAESIKIFYNTFISTKVALVNMIQDVAEVNGNINVDVVTNALAKSDYRITGPAYMKAGMGDGGACHPRDNIALRYLAENLGLGYDLFDAIMRAREVQAERMALRCLKNGNNITIVGKAYKPAVPYLNGSASMLVGHYIEKHGGNVRYYDKNTGDNDLHEDWTDAYLIGYWDEFVKQISFPDHVTVIDPWRKLTARNHEVIHYGDSRPVRKNKVTPEQIQHHKEEIRAIFTELTPSEIDDKIHVIYAGIHPQTSFLLHPFEDIIEEIREALANGKTKFLFDALLEGFLPHVVRKIQRIANVLGPEIKSENLFYLTGALDGEKVYENLKYRNKITVLSSSSFEYLVRKFLKFPGFEIPRFNIGLKSKKFLCFNKVHREHRMMLLEKIIPSGLLEQSYFSFQGTEKWESDSKFFGDNFKNIRDNLHLFPMTLNITTSRQNPIDIIQDDLKYFTDSYFSVVTETLFKNQGKKYSYNTSQAEPCIFPSEKIYKCLALSHPFIVLSCPGFLEGLRTLGYKTFAPYINEKYDTIQDDVERLEAVFNEIKRLSSQSDDEMIEWQRNIKSIVDYNREVFFNKKSFVVSPNILKYFEN